MLAQNQARSDRKYMTHLSENSCHTEGKQTNNYQMTIIAHKLYHNVHHV